MWNEFEKNKKRVHTGKSERERERIMLMKKRLQSSAHKSERKLSRFRCDRILYIVHILYRNRI